MKKDELHQSWSGKSEEILTGMLEWRQQHPKATFREIEGEVDQRLAVLRAKMIADAALAYAQSEWEPGSAENVSGMWEAIGEERQEKAQAANEGRTGSGTGTRIWGLSGLWARDFSPWMKS